MNARIRLLLMLLLSFAGPQLHAQVDCPPNVDFEDGTTSVWHYYVGRCCPIVTPTVTPAIVNRHTLTSGSSVDIFGLFPVVAPDGGGYSLKLGNDSSGSQAEKARYYVHIPASSSNYSLIYRYAVVFENPLDHTYAQQPRFEVHAYDSVTSSPIPCAQFVYVADSTLPGFHLSARLGSGGARVYYKGWTTGIIDLSGHGGTTVTIDFASGDCSLGAHFGYGYLDMTCGLFEVSKTNCTPDSVTLDAPLGFDFYSWYDSSLTTLIGTTPTIRVPNTGSRTTYAVIVAPYPGYGCPDTLYSTVINSGLALNPTPDTTVCNHSGVTITAGATGFAMPFRYLWTPAVGLSCTTCASPFATPVSRTSYVVTVTDTMGCSISDTISVAVGIEHNPSHDTLLCPGASTVLTTGATGTALPFIYTWSPAAGLSCTACATPTANPSTNTSYIATVTDTAGCTVSDTILVSRSNFALPPGYDTSICGTHPVILGLGASSSAPLVYTWTPSTGLSCTTCPAPTATPTVTTSYLANVTDSNNCTGTDTVRVLVKVLLPPLHDTILCPGDSTMLSTSVSGSSSPVLYSWSPASGLSCTNCPSPFANPLTTTTYIVTVSDTTGCALSDTLKVSRDDLSASSGTNVALCEHITTPLTIAVTDALYPVHYSWSPSTGLDCNTCSSVTADPPGSVVYIASATNSIGCVVKDTFNVFRSNLNVTIGSSIWLCQNQTSALAPVATGNAQPFSYAWSPATGLNCANCPSPTADPAQATDYSVTITDSIGCTKTAAITVNRDFLRPVRPVDTVICAGYPLDISPRNSSGDGPFTYQWLGNLNCSQCEAQTVIPYDTTQYYVLITDSHNCSITDSITVNTGDCDIWFPNAFSPNGDGLNDFARVVGHLNFFTDFSLSIYNRFGQRVFFTQDIHAGWDGIFNGEKQDLGTYYYMIFYTLYDKKHMLKGDIELVK